MKEYRTKQINFRVTESEYKIARAEMQELLTAKQNVEQFLGKQNLQKQDIQKRKGETSL